MPNFKNENIGKAKIEQNWRLEVSYSCDLWYFSIGSKKRKLVITVHRWYLHYGWDKFKIYSRIVIRWGSWYWSMSAYHSSYFFQSAFQLHCKIKAPIQSDIKRLNVRKLLWLQKNVFIFKSYTLMFIKQTFFYHYDFDCLK
jgi:hypothetical protein